MVMLRRYAGLAAIALLGVLTSSCADDPTDPPAPTGSLQVAIAGLPDTIDAAVTLSGPGGFSETIKGSKTVAALVPGTYTIAAARVTTSIATFVPAFESLQLTVGANSVSQATVVYAVSTGSLSLIVAGVPPDVPGKVQVVGPNGFRDSVSSTRTLGNLAQGVYTISVGEVNKGLNIYSPKTGEFVVTIAPSITPSRATVEYLLVTGTLNVNVHGLPDGVRAAFSVSGPVYTATGAGSLTLEGLRQGRYSIVASAVGSGASLHNPSPASQSVAVIAGSAAVANVNYSAAQPAPGLNLTIDAVQVQQVVQSYGGTVPTIAGRDALLRVFVRASEPNAHAPAVRVNLYDGLQLVSTQTISAPAGSVPVSAVEGTLTSSWNLALPASLIRPGLRVLAEVDPGNAIAETAENDNMWPTSGTPLALDVRATAPLAVRIVPITITASGLTGNVTAAHLALYESAARQLLPLSTITTELRPAFTSSAPALQPNDINGAWVQVLSELNALRAAEGSQAHYYGVVKVPYSAGLVGISYLPSFAAIGHDTLPNATATFVHELGHHFGRLHAPACGAGGFDANYPHAGGTIGAWGFDAASMTLRPPSTSDIMGYCDGRWISDYTFTGILGYRATQLSAAVAMAAKAPQRGLLIWGRIGAQGLVLEPAFEVDAPALLPNSAGPHRLEILDGSGRVAWSAAFRGERTIDTPWSEEHFAFVVPLASLRGDGAARIRLASYARQVELRPATSPRGVLVRDSRTGAILALGRSGSVDLKVLGRELDLTLSDGVRSIRRRVVVR